MSTWPWKSLGELVADEPHSLTDGPFGSKLKSEHYTTDGTRVVRLGNIGVGVFKNEDCSYVSNAHAASLQRHSLYSGDLLIAALAEPVGRCCAVPESILPAIVKADCIRFRPAPDMNPRFVMHWLNSPDAVKNAEAKSHGVGRLRINLVGIRSLPVPKPPRAVQDAVTEAIETEFSRLEHAIVSLQRSQANVKRARASVLKAAVEGRLVPSRANQSCEAAAPPNTGEALRPQDATREARLDRPRETRTPTAERLPPERPLKELPAGWKWLSMKEVATVSGGVTKNASRATQALQLPYLRVANVHANDLRLSDIATIGVSQPELERSLLQTGDLLIVEGNGSADQIGRVAVWLGAIAPCVHQNHIIKARPGKVVTSRWLLWWLLSPMGREAIQASASSTSGLHTLSLSKVETLPVPLPPLAEQHRIVAEIDRRMSVLDALDASIDANLARCERLRQSILKRAFEGRLVPATSSSPASGEPIAASPTHDIPVVADQPRA